MPHAIRNMPLEGQECTVVGWGKTAADSGSNELSDVLRKVDLNVEKDEVCHNMYLIYNPITQMCLKGEENKNTCEGDSGTVLISIMIKCE